MLYAENKVANDELRRNEYLFWGVAIAVCLMFLGTDAWWGREAFFAEAVREMVRDSRIFPPSVNGTELYGVPLPLLWEGMLCGKIFGISEWSLRIITGLHALWLLAGTMVLGNRFAGRRVALFSGILLLGSCGFLYTARLYLGVIPAAACGIWATLLFAWGEGRYRVVRILGAGALLLLALFFGTFYAVLPPLAAGLVLSRSEEKTRSKGVLAAWIIVFIAIPAAAVGLHSYGVLPPGYPDFSGRFGIDLMRAAGFDAFRVFFPWSLWGIVAVVRNLWRFRTAERDRRCLTVAVIAVWLIMIVPAMENWRQMIYLLPVLSILTAAELSEERSGSRISTAIDIAVRYFVMLAGAVAVASIVVIPIWKILFQVEISPYILWSVPVIGLLAQTFLLFDARAAVRFALPQRCGGTVLAALTLTATVFCVIRPNFATLRSGRRFILTSLRPQLKNLPRGAVLYYGGAPDASVLYYVGADTPFAVATCPDELRSFLAGNAEHFVAVVADADRAMKAEIAAVAAEFDLLWETPAAEEKLTTPDENEHRLALFFGSVAAKTEESPTVIQEEKP